MRDYCAPAAARGIPKPPRFPHHLEQSLLALHAEDEMRGYLQAAVDLLSAAVPHDTSYVLLHYFDGIAYQSLTYDTRGRVYDDLDYQRRHAELNPATPIVQADPGRKLITITDCLPTEEAVQQSPFYHEIMVPLDFRWAVALLFWSPKLDAIPCTLALHRTREEGDFTSQELTLL